MTGGAARCSGAARGTGDAAGAGLSAEDRWLSSDEGTEWVIRSVDRIWDVARGAEGLGGLAARVQPLRWLVSLLLAVMIE